MKRIIIAIIGILTIFMGSRGEIRKPDFAFPATVVKDAQKALKEADKQHDAVSAIEALIQIYYFY